MLHFLLKYSLEFQNKIRVEPDKDGFMRDSGEYFDDMKGNAERCVGGLTDCL